MAYFWFGFSAADAVVASPQRKPTATIRSSPMKAFMRSGRSLLSAAVGADSSVATPKLALAASRADAAASLKDLSPRPVTSNRRPIFLPAPSAVSSGRGGTSPVPASHLPVPPPAVVAAPPAVVAAPPAVVAAPPPVVAAPPPDVVSLLLLLLAPAGDGQETEAHGERGCAHEVAPNTHALPLQLWNR